MPANLTPDYLAAEREYKAAPNHAEKIAALERMLATVPKHKGTEKLQADLKRKLSQARKESHQKGGAHSTPFYLVEKEGAGQVVLLGAPNAGKSQLVRALTHAHPEVAGYPFTTRFPTPGMMRYENVQIQLEDLPAISPEFTEPWIPQVVRNADAALLLADLADPGVLDGIEFILQTLAERRLAPPLLLVGAKLDVPQAGETFVALQDLYGARFSTVAVSALTGQNLDRFARAVFDLLGLVRVYTKAPGHTADFCSPFVTRRGTTVQDAARLVHKDFAEHLKYARLYHRSGSADGMMVERHHLVEDEDILEFHI